MIDQNILQDTVWKSDTWVQKKSSKNSKKQFSLFKKFNQDIEKSWSY